MDVTFVCSSSGEAPFKMEVGFFDTVLDIKHKLQGRNGWPAAALSLFHDGGALVDDDAAGAGVTERYGVVEGSVIHVALDGAGDGDDRRPRQKGKKNGTRRPGKGMRAPAPEPLRVTVVSRCGAGRVEVAVRARGAVSALRRELEGGASSGSGFPLPADGGYFFIHGQSVMDEARSFEWHGVAAGDEVVVFEGSVTRAPAC
ncbi:hypothetical protein CFC21_072124 [Triticum aestivum]|uniref:Polyubiquitin-like protein n=3 Tax=Triticum TaxID=4564 RepID=A0A9R1HJQ1_WHEAT|nr:uncharacterized protein LOC119309624 [Triticum dicoccoides]KAF7066077.1 hypothetical protein CFC21_072124 [Triticum aestivum]CAJ19359.1 polyubiquitin-like protein [Triticum aestivum]VAI33548.1 unnamed protein product [Triticum turgidum subsp. durum]